MEKAWVIDVIQSRTCIIQELADELLGYDTAHSVQKGRCLQLSHELDEERQQFNERQDKGMPNLDIHQADEARLICSRETHLATFLETWSEYDSWLFSQHQFLDDQKSALVSDQAQLIDLITGIVNWS